MTDGLTETQCAASTFFGHERALEVIAETRHLEAQEIVNSLYRAARDFADHGHQLDDITVVVCKVLSAG
jgi:serine phosphatase RsbU (regulator of sigma subunit)